MPKIETGEGLFFKLLGEELDDAALEALLPVAKAELDGRADGVIKFELNDTNRPDLWSAAGLARALRAYRTGAVTLYDFFSSKEESLDTADRVLVCHKEARAVRPYCLGFAAEGGPVTDDILKALIQTQEKICSNYGRKRRTIAMGIYRSDLITYPVHYTGADPDKTRFVPLGSGEEMSLREMTVRHPKGIEFGKIVAGSPVFPYLHDDKGQALSFPPVINSARIGAVEVGDENLFVEVSGTRLADLLLAIAVVACDMADLGFRILPLKVRFEEETPFGKEIAVPYYFQEPAGCLKADIGKVSGLELSDDEIRAALRRMGIHCVVDAERVYATVPEYRNDFLHPVDLVEDIVIGHGLEKFAPVLPSDFTIGRLTRTEELSRKVKGLMVGLGFQEMIYNYLGSRRDYIDRMNLGPEAAAEALEIANPMSENYEMVRPSIIPCLLGSESVSKDAAYPHAIFEIGKTARKCPSDNSGARTMDCLGFFSSDRRMGYNEAASIVGSLMYFLAKPYTLSPLEGDGRFIGGRCARILIGGKEAGVFGEIHPQVLENWGCAMPAIACEIDLSALLGED